MSNKKRYILTAAIGDQLPGTVIEITNEQAESPLYASRIGEPTEAQADNGPSYDEIRAQVLAELESKVPEYLANAKNEGARLVAEGEAKAAELVKEGQDKFSSANDEAKRLVEQAKTEATKLVTEAQAEAVRMATAKK